MRCLLFIYLEKRKWQFLMNKADKNKVYRIWFYLFLASFFLGVMIMNMGDETLLGDAGIFNLASMNRLKYIEINHGKFFQHVLKKRIGECAALLLLSTTALGMVTVYAAVFWQGMLTGMIMTAAAIRYGLKGILLILGGMFPHQCLLFPAGVMLLGWCLENYFLMHTFGRGVSPLFHNRRQQLLHQGILLMWIMLVMLIGCILESYVNPILISDLIKIF